MFSPLETIPVTTKEESDFDVGSNLGRNDSDRNRNPKGTRAYAVVHPVPIYPSSSHVDRSTLQKVALKLRREKRRLFLEHVKDHPKAIKTNVKDTTAFKAVSTNFKRLHIDGGCLVGDKHSAAKSANESVCNRSSARAA